MPLSSRNSSVSRDFILLFAVIMGIIVLVAVWVAYKTFENYSENVVSEMEDEAMRMDRSLSVDIKNASYLLESLARQIVQMGADNPEKISLLLRSFDTSNNANKDEFAWVDSDQEIIITSSSGLLEKTINVSDRDYVKKSLAKPWQVHIGRPLRARISERWVLPISVGVTDYRGDFVGILLLSMDIESLATELSDMLRQSGMQFAVFTPTLTLIADSEKIAEEDIYDRSKSTALTEMDFSKQRKGLLSSPQIFSPETTFVYYEYSAYYPYVIYLTYDPITNRDKIYPLLQARLVQILVIAVFLLALLWMVRTRIIKPVERLCDITAGIAAGRGYKPMPKGGPIEIESLANQIRKLSDYISEQHRIEQELTLKNQFLMKLKETSHVVARARSEFLTGVTRELDEQVRAMLPSVQAINEQRHGVIRQVKYAEEAKVASAHLLELQHIIHDVRAIAEMERETLVLRESSVNISFAMHRAVRQFQQHGEYRHIKVKLKVSDTLPVLVIDEERFTQVLVHLLCGAAATLSQGTAITLSAQTEHNEGGATELVLSMKYASYQAPMPPSDVNTTASAVMETALEAGGGTPVIRTEAMCFALARMLLSLYDGDMSFTPAKGEMHHVFVRFPKARLMLK
jgi:signal transduction histidine kinase